MRSKIGIGVIVIVLTIIFGVRSEKRVFGCSSALAQEAEDADSLSDDTSATENSLESNEPGAKPTPISASGIYSGTVMDSVHGAGTISAAISQIRNKVIGTWQDTFVPPAFINGTINAKGNMSLQMRFFITGKCGYLFKGVFQHGDEISGTYKLNGCKGMKPEHGSLDMTRQ